jgi:hypothetical protein
MGFEAECSYPSVALPVYVYQWYQFDRVKMANIEQWPKEWSTNLLSDSVLGTFVLSTRWYKISHFDYNPSASPLTGEKRPRVAGSSERTELVNDVVAVHINLLSDSVLGTFVLSTRWYKISHFDSVKLVSLVNMYWNCVTDYLHSLPELSEHGLWSRMLISFRGLTSWVEHQSSEWFCSGHFRSQY